MRTLALLAFLLSFCIVANPLFGAANFSARPTSEAGAGALLSEQALCPGAVNFFDRLGERAREFTFRSARPARQAMGKTMSDPTPVISLTIIDGTTLGPQGEITDQTRMLVGVRNEAHNMTHPGVISTPTERVPKSIFEAIVRSAKQTKIARDFSRGYPEKLSRASALSGSISDSRKSNAHDSLLYAVKSILSLKLGVAGALEKGELRFTARPVALLAGRVLYPDEAPGTKEYSHIARHAVPVMQDGKSFLREYHRMCAIEVVLDHPDRIPASTVSYSELHWIAVEQFLQMAKSRSLDHLKQILVEKIRYEVHGLCILSPFAYLSRLDTATRITPLDKSLFVAA